MGEALLEATQMLHSSTFSPFITLYHHQLLVFLVSGEGTNLYFYTFLICSIRALLDELQMYTNFRGLAWSSSCPVKHAEWVFSFYWLWYLNKESKLHFWKYAGLGGRRSLDFLSVLLASKALRNVRTSKPLPLNTAWWRIYMGLWILASPRLTLPKPGSSPLGSSQPAFNNTNLSPHVLFYQSQYVLPVCMYVYQVHAWCLQKLDEALGLSPLKWVTGGCELPCSFWEPKCRSSARATCHLNPKPPSELFRLWHELFSANSLNTSSICLPSSSVLPVLYTLASPSFSTSSQGNWETPKQSCTRDGTFTYSPKLTMFPIWLKQNI